MPRRSCRRFTAAERSAHLSAWSKSGQSAKSYAQASGIRLGNLYRWSHVAKHEKSRQPGATFLPVRLGAPSATAACEVILRADSFECSIRSNGSTREELVSLIKSLKEEVFDV